MDNLPEKPCEETAAALANLTAAVFEKWVQLLHPSISPLLAHCHS
jgi:hypothetical protein